MGFFRITGESEKETNMKLSKLEEKNPITCKCGKHWGKAKQGLKCSRCRTIVTFKMDHANKLFKNAV